MNVNGQLEGGIQANQESRPHIEAGKVYKLHTAADDQDERYITFKARPVQFKQAESLALFLTSNTHQAKVAQYSHELK